MRSTPARFYMPRGRGQKGGGRAMCGIAGWYRRGNRPVATEVIGRQCDTIVHRGPDDVGCLAEGDFGFGMRRLSIIDLASGHQPIETADGRYAIVFNGEIYNHPELRRELIGAGITFHTNSDTETLLHAFVRWGEGAWPRLQGMFAVAIWDRRERRLTLARDPLGIKPLYLTEQAGGLAFASEIRALAVLPEHRFEVDERAAHDFFTYGHVQPPRSIYRQVRCLPPGTTLTIGPDGAGVERTYWQPRFATRHDLDEGAWIEETRDRVRRTVEQHMLADVPVGVFLSGGVDSSAVAAAMSRVASGRVKAFTMGFAGTSIDETAAAARIAGHLGLEHRVLQLEPQVAGDLLPAVQAAFDEPNASTASVPIWHLSRMAAGEVKVVLCGDGADEILAGYKRQRTALAAARWAPAMRVLGPVGALVDALPPSTSPRWNYLRQNARRFRDAAALRTAFQRFFAGTQITSPAVRARLFDPGFLDRQEGTASFARLEAEYFPDAADRALDPLQQFMLADVGVHMLALLNRLDRGSMAHSLEARVPFLSPDFVDWALTMPRSMMLRGKVGKYALRQAIAPWLPADALDKRKLGFQLPFAEWFRGDFATFAREAWHDSGAVDSGYLRPEAVDALFAEHRAGRANHGRTLYAIAMFSCWWQQTKAAGAARAA